MMNSYFPHESNARNDEKLIALRMKKGWEGYGIYWAIIEKLRDTHQLSLSTEYELIAYDLRTDVEIVRSIINDFGLFQITDNSFHCPALSAQMEIKNIKTTQTQNTADPKWKKNVSKKKKQDDNKKKEYTIPPHIEEVEEYCKERDNGIEPTLFVEYYQSKDWMVGSTKMKDWKAAIRRWEAKNKNNTQKEYNANDDNTRIHPALQ